MPPELSAVLDDSPEHLPVTLGNGVTFTLEYHPARVTPRWLMTLMDAEKSPQAVVPALLDVLSGWDVVQNGTPLPLTKDVLLDMKFPVLAAMMAAISEAAAGSEEKNDSNASTELRPSGSTSPPSTENPPNGTGSPQQLGSGAVPSGIS